MADLEKLDDLDSGTENQELAQPALSVLSENENSRNDGIISPSSEFVDAPVTNENENSINDAIKNSSIQLNDAAVTNINDTNQENSPDLVQDITEESETDLQMVLNKVSETLKSLNQNVISRPGEITDFSKSGNLSSEKIEIPLEAGKPAGLDENSISKTKTKTETNLMEVDDGIDLVEKQNDNLNVNSFMDVDKENDGIKNFMENSNIKTTQESVEKDESNSTELFKVWGNEPISTQSRNFNEFSGKLNPKDISLITANNASEPDNQNNDKTNFADTLVENSGKNTESLGESSSAVKNEEKYMFYNKECVNSECEHNSKIFFQSFSFILSFYQVSLKSKQQFVCLDCYDKCVNKYEEWNQTLDTGKPLLLAEIPLKKQDFVEILDSDDEECDGGKEETTIAEGKKTFNTATLELIEKNLTNIMEKKFEEFGIQNQLTWWKQILTQKLTKQQQDCEYITNSVNSMQKSADAMYTSLYQSCKHGIRPLTPLDLNTGKAYNIGEASQTNQFAVPPFGEIERPSIIVGNEYFAVKSKVMASWLPCKVLEIVGHSEKEATYKVKYLKIKTLTFKNVTAKHMAYNESPKVQLVIGTRVLALFDSSTLFKDSESNAINDVKSAFYPGIIAEALQSYNNFRYLIFFDDGYTQYVHHRDVRLICETSTKVWEDIHESSREFIQNYLINYKKNRPMVQVKKGQTMITELNGKWIYAKVIDVDASLIQMQFEEQKNYTEWIYRGSTRLGPLFKAIQKTDIPGPTRVPRRSEPYVRYMQDDENSANRTQQPVQPPARSVAKKTTTKQQIVEQSLQEPTQSNQPIKHLNNSTIFVDDEEPKGKLVYYSAKIDSNPPPEAYIPHECSEACSGRRISMGCSYGVLSKPLLNGWQRSIFKENSKKRTIIYTAPCGRRLRSMEEVHTYLRLVKVIGLNVENFVFDPECGCLTEYQVQRCIVNKQDLSDGVEPIPIQCINYYDHTMPPNCIYSAERLPTEGVNLNTDPEFLVGCDCEDDCKDKSKCSCWQLTLQGAKFSNPLASPDTVGYYYKRLLEPVITGIYECNVRCKCAKTCINRVVQHPLETKLQTFKTSNRGWGLRCINDIPKGTFICIYAGELLTEQKANEANSGDEYFAELDYIEVAERLKEGYESEPDIPEETFSDEDDYTPDDNDKEFSTRAARAEQSPLTTRSNNRGTAVKSTSTRQSVSNDDDEEEQERIAINFDPKTSLANVDEEVSNTRYKSMRKLFGKNEFIYVMDAKNTGNVGRYFNHSCSPNLFVQNVFVDTQDLRFPWVAFFALSQIRAGTELTWNYNYEVGVVPGKVLYCECGAPNCRGRLL